MLISNEVVPLKNILAKLHHLSVVANMLKTPAAIT